MKDAYYIPGKGVAGSARTQSKDGTFAASPDGYGREVLFLVTENLRLDWHLRVEKDYFTVIESIFCDDGIYVLSGKDETTSYRKYNYKGKLTFEEKWARATKRYTFVGNSALGLVISEYGDDPQSYRQAEKLIFRNERDIVLELPFDEGYVNSVLDMDFGILVVSWKNTGIQRDLQYTTASFISPYLHQTVWSAYDTNGNLLWRTASEPK